MGKISSAFRVLKDMEKKGCSKSLQTYNSLILGFGSKSQNFEVYGLMDEMKERGIAPNIGEFRAAQEVFDIALSISGHKEVLYSLMFNELLAEGEVLEAKELFEAALDRCLDVGNFLYKDLIDRLCKDELLDSANDILKKMLYKGYGFDPASFMPVIEGLGKGGNKHEADELAEWMLEMAYEGKIPNKVCRHVGVSESAEKEQVQRGQLEGHSAQIIVRSVLSTIKSAWPETISSPIPKALLDDSSGVALKTLNRVQKGWGQGSIPGHQPQKDDLLNIWDITG
ncbi:hypothetical protein RJ639_011497 [Escallonia herrerae]|uniref:Pentatricopeptide repeat-containing protein n=1 Tax=Escallonia herrerae TaxID=1293975 RepID=A0AA89AQU6_9ASTE|nr:hypothetical protein RJ639_011497 [Escallonia herrerae]